MNLYPARKTLKQCLWLSMLTLSVLESIPAQEKTVDPEVPLTPEETEWLRSKKVIRFGADPAWPPFSTKTPEGLTGIDQDLIELFADRLNVKFEYIPAGNWEETLEQLERGDIDFISGFANLPERPAKVLYTASYTNFPVAIIMRNDGPFFTSLDQIENHDLLLAAPEGYAPTIYIEQNFPGIKTTTTNTSLDALRMVSNGSADITVENLGVAAHLIRVNGLLNLKITGPTPHHFDPSFGVRPDLPELRSILDKSLDSITSREKLHIYQRWVLVDIDRMWSWQKVGLIGGIILLTAALAVGVFWAWNRRLGEELEARRVIEESLRQSEARFRRLFERMDDAYFLTDSDGKIRFVNEPAVEMLGIGSRLIVERLGLTTFLERSDELAEILEELRSGKNLRDRPVEFLLANGSRSLHHCRIRLLSVDDTGGEVGIEWIARTAT